MNTGIKLVIDKTDKYLKNCNIDDYGCKVYSGVCTLCLQGCARFTPKQVACIVHEMITHETDGEIADSEIKKTYETLEKLTVTDVKEDITKEIKNAGGKIKEGEVAYRRSFLINASAEGFKTETGREERLYILNDLPLHVKKIYEDANKTINEMIENEQEDDFIACLKDRAKAQKHTEWLAQEIERLNNE